MNDLQKAAKLEAQAKSLREKRISKDSDDRPVGQVNINGEICLLGDRRNISFETLERLYKLAKKYQPKRRVV